MNTATAPSAASAATTLRHGADALAQALPPLMASAEQLAATVMLGEHGRRRSGRGDEFWQYRPVAAGDEARLVDWRRSARSDQHFVREKEWQAAQSVLIWVDGGPSMAFSGAAARPTKGDRARLLAMAAAVLLIRGGERVGLSGLDTPPRSGPQQVLRLAAALSVAGAGTGAGQGAKAGADEYPAPEVRGVPAHSRALFASDYLGDIAAVETALTAAADRGVRGAMLQVLDRVEEEFPFDGRTIFTSMAGGLRHETLKAGDLRSRYLDRLAERKDRLAALAQATGWLYLCHHTSDPAQGALLWLYHALERGA